MFAATPTAAPTLFAATTDAVPAHRVGEVDNRSTYISFGLAYVLGHGAAAVSKGASPLVALPGWLPMALLGTGLAVGTVYSTVAAIRAQRGASRSDVLSGKLLGASWISAFTALFLAITGLAYTLDMPDLQTMLWPTGSGFVVGLIYLGEGAVRRNLLHYGLGTWLALISTAALFLGAPGLFWVLAIAGGGGYAVASVLEPRRLTALAKQAQR
ncbi:ABC transporter permease [Sorangium sp. So ce834]|uniref:ABC transporter permease n=1 Tax=Sorangium sp. So ce834 TaxID=3133321 RepID=UPI003F5EE24B